MSGSGVVVFYAVVFALDLDLVEHCLKLADDRHVAVDAHEIFLGVESLLLFKGLVILADRNIGEMDIARFKGFFRIDELTLRHDIYLLK